MVMTITTIKGRIRNEAPVTERKAKAKQDLIPRQGMK